MIINRFNSLAFDEFVEYIDGGGEVHKIEIRNLDDYHGPAVLVWEAESDDAFHVFGLDRDEWLKSMATRAAAECLRSRVNTESIARQIFLVDGLNSKGIEPVLEDS